MSLPHSSAPPSTGAPTRTDVAIVGAGFAGIAMALRLRSAGHHDFLLLERAESVGGTWRENTYPGVACDVPSHLYGFADHPNPDWSANFARGSEIHAYLQEVAQREGLQKNLHLRTALTDARWDPVRTLWRISTRGAGPAEIEARALVLACGRLTEPVIPDVSGLSTFPGAIFHSSRWQHDIDLSDKRVAVVGTGASAVQLVPHLAREAATLTVFQRTPAWIVPRDDHAYSAKERELFRQHPETLAHLRAELYAEGEQRFASRSGDRDAAAAAAAIADAHRIAHVSDPALAEALRPTYAFGCKRVLLSDDFYPALSRDSVTLEASALARIDGSSLTSAHGTQYEADVLVLATGFVAAAQPYAELVTGETTTLAEHWSQGMTSFASTSVSGFPNMFVLNGPNASLGHNSAVLMAEAQAHYVERSLRRRANHDGVLRVDPEAERAYSARIDHAASPTPWLTGGCHNWYVDARSGRLTLLWPGTVDAFRDMLADTTGAEFLSPAPAPVPTLLPTPPASMGTP